MQTLYQIVGRADVPAAKLLTGSEFLALVDVDGAKIAGGSLRPELQGQPVIAGLCGPMWGGWRDAAGEYVFLDNDRDQTSPPKSYSPSQGPIAAKVIRYETWEAYEQLSR